MPSKHILAITAILAAISTSAASVTLAQDARNNTAPDPWSSFTYPAVVVVDKDNGATEGASLVHKLVPDLEAFIREIALGVCKTLYKEPNEEVGKLLDGNPRSKFCVQASKTQIQYVVPGKHRLYAYAFTSANDAPSRDPENWTLEASNNGTDWTVLDRQEGQVFEHRHQAKQFVVDCATAYDSYRWNLEARSDRTFQIAEIEMFGFDAK